MPDRDLSALIERAEALIAAVTYDDSGSMGRGGNGGLLSRDTIRKADELRLALYDAKRALRSRETVDGAHLTKEGE